MFKRFVVLGLVMFFAGASVFAVDVVINPPTINGDYAQYFDFDQAVNDFMGKAFSELDRFDKMTDLLKAMSNASSFAADGATIRNFLGYDIFTIAIGTMGAVQNKSFDIADTLNNFEGDEDIFFGVNAQAITVSAGVNLGAFVEGLYVSAKVGTFSFNISDFDISTFSCGLMAHYQLVKPKSALAVAWKGLQVGAGIIYYKSDLSYKTDASIETNYVNLESSSAPGMSAGTATLVFEPELKMEFSTKGIKIPVDVMTGIRLAILDVSFGLGVDINIWSDSDLTYNVKGPAYLEGLPMGLTATPGSAKVSGGTTGGSADIFNFKAMAGLGISLGPVKLDVPLTYYFGEKGPGANLGVTIGAAF